MAGGPYASLDQALAAAGTSAWVQVVINGQRLWPRQRLASVARAVHMRGLLVGEEAFSPVGSPRYNIGQGAASPLARWHMREDRPVGPEAGGRARIQATHDGPAWGEAALRIANPAATWTLFAHDSTLGDLARSSMGLRHEESGNIVMSWNDGAVGIGAIPTAARLTVAGDVRVSDRYRLSTVRTNWVAYSGPHFEFTSAHRLIERDNPMYRHETGLLVSDVPAEWNGIAAVRLPQGVRVTHMTAYYADHAPGHLNLRAAFARRHYQALAFADLAVIEADTAGRPPGNYSSSVANINHIIDNDQYAYALIVWFDTAGSFGANQQGFLGIRLRYDANVMGVGR